MDIKYTIISNTLESYINIIGELWVMGYLLKYKKTNELKRDYELQNANGFKPTVSTIVNLNDWRYLDTVSHGMFGKDGDDYKAIYNDLTDYAIRYIFCNFKREELDGFFRDFYSGLRFHKTICERIINYIENNKEKHPDIFLELKL